MPDIELLGRKLQSADAEERREAAVDLGRAGAEALPFLFRALSDSDWRVRKTAVEALVEQSNADVIAGLVRTLFAQDNAGARNSAMEALVHIGPAAVDALLAAADSRDPDVRKFIVDILGDIRDRRSVPALIVKLSDPDENIRVAAAEALGKIRDPRAVDPLLACLGRYDRGWLDYAAAEALGEIGDERALGPLMAALGRSSLREPVLESLGKIGNIDTLEPLIAGLADPLRIVREVAVNALVAIFRKSSCADREIMADTMRQKASDRAVDFLEEILITSAGELQKAAVAVLGWVGREGSIRRLLELLKEEELEEPTFHALKRIEASKAGILLEYLRSDNPLVQRTVARALGAIGMREAEDALIGLLRDENGHVRSAAAEALGQLKSRKAVDGLAGLLTDEYESVQESAIRALSAIGDESVLDRLIKDYTSRNVRMRRNIALLLGSFSTEKSGEALAFALKDAEPDVRKAVVHALSRIEYEQARRPLLLAVTDDDPEVRMLAAEALGREGRFEVIDTLVSLLRDPDLWVRASAARGLGRIGGERAALALAASLGSASDIFLLALIEVLGRLSVSATLKPLLELSRHDDPEVRKTVLAALEGHEWETIRAAVLARLSDPHWSVRKTAIEIVRQQRDRSATALLERIADADEDGSVRQAAREALEH